jgi:hypothetical protein
MSSGHLIKGESLGDREFDKAMAHPKVRQRLARHVSLSRDWDIPYLGGYSMDGRTIYLDRHLPRRFLYRGRQVDTDRFLILHEEIEKTLIDMLDMHYAHAHEIATRAEENAVREAGIDVNWYRKMLKPLIKADALERLLRVPGALDMTPYREGKVDQALLRRMQHAMNYPGPAGKLSDEVAGYHKGPGAHGHHCGICELFSAPHGCTVVTRANADDGCDFFVRNPQQEQSHVGHH